MDGELSQDFGDAIPLEYLDRMIRDRERLIHLQAAERGVPASIWDDVLNEARITIWKVAKEKTGKVDNIGKYVNKATGMRITELLMPDRGQNWTGYEGTRGKAIDPIRRIDRDSFDDPDWEVEIAAPDDFDSIMLAYHEGEIMQALAALPYKHRRYVEMRFWEGCTSGEIAPFMGVKTTNLARVWHEQIKPPLLARLEHLAGAA